MNILYTALYSEGLKKKYGRYSNMHSFLEDGFYCASTKGITGMVEHYLSLFVNSHYLLITDGEEKCTNIKKENDESVIN